MGFLTSLTRSENDCSSMMFVENLWTSQVSTLEYSRFFLLFLCFYEMHYINWITCSQVSTFHVPTWCYLNRASKSFGPEGMGDWWRSPWKVWDLQSWRVQLSPFRWYFWLPSQLSCRENNKWYRMELMCDSFLTKHFFFGIHTPIFEGMVYTWYRSRRYIHV